MEIIKKFKMSRSAFESCIRAKMGNPHDFDNIDIIEDENCEKCELCGWLIAESKDVKFHNGRKLCEQCNLGEIENPELILLEERH